MRTLRSLSLLVALLATAFLGTAALADEAVVDDGSVVTVGLTANDSLQFSLSEIRVAEGRKIRLTLTNTGQGDASVMGHNFVLLTPGTDINQFGIAAVAARDAGYIPADQKDRVVAHTDVIGGGESTTIDFDAPAAGTYDFICSFMGHYSIMRGKLVVG
jgi:azurin